MKIQLIFRKMSKFQLIFWNHHIMMSSGPRNRQYDSAYILGPDIFILRWFLAPEIVQKSWFLAPENFIMTKRTYIKIWDLRKTIYGRRRFFKNHPLLGNHCRIMKSEHIEGDKNEKHTIQWHCKKIIIFSSADLIYLHFCSLCCICDNNLIYRGYT